MRRVSLFLMGIGVSSEMVAITGMILGILAGLSFMGTSEEFHLEVFWILGMVFCVLRIACIQVDSILQHPFAERSLEDVFFNELPERVSDAITLIGFGFAMDSSPWLGLAAALAAIFSAYVRSFGVSRGVGERSAARGPMTRVHRLALLSLTSILMAVGVSTGTYALTIPQVALWVIILGCVATILVRWLKIRNV
ncbi:MAG: hypothetical protein WD342_02300 [Verrucomicrobiales bacterium]